MTSTLHHRIVIVGGGTAGITVAARLRRKGETDIVIVEPSATHVYQPLWTLVGSGHATAEETKRPMADVIPQVYAELDGVVGHTLARMGEGTLLIVMSDHGFTAGGGPST